MLLNVDKRAVATASNVPPKFVQLAAHPVRWRLLRELTRSDLAVSELTERVGEPQNLVSYHLRKLRDGGLVFARRSTADRRDSYYAIDLASCEQQLHATASALHPALATATPPRAPAGYTRRGRRPSVLFLCTGNSARSQIAAALIAHRSGGAVVATSAGSDPKPLHPNAVRVMRERGIDISANRSTNVATTLNRRFDLVITLCDRVREVCPEFPSRPEFVHWSLPDPAQEGASERESYPAFQRTADELEARIRFLLPQLVVPSAVSKRRSSHDDR
jgi:protein-tyrosine-phosphatase/DNA-binding transcriptional ArsR family regulator